MISLQNNLTRGQTLCEVQRTLHRNKLKIIGVVKR